MNIRWDQRQRDGRRSGRWQGQPNTLLHGSSGADRSSSEFRNNHTCSDAAVRGQKANLMGQIEGPQGPESSGEEGASWGLRSRRPPASHRGFFLVTKIRTRRMATSRSLREVMARMVSWARLSRGRTARSHQYQAGPLGKACRNTEPLHYTGATLYKNTEPHNSNFFCVQKSMVFKPFYRKNGLVDTATWPFSRPP